MSLRNVLQLREKCGIWQGNPAPFANTVHERQNAVSGSVVGGVESGFMSLKVIKSICFERCELRWEYTNCSNMELLHAQVL